MRKKTLPKLPNGSTAKGGRPRGAKTAPQKKRVPLLLRQMRWVFRHDGVEEAAVPQSMRGVRRWYMDDFKGFMGQMARLELQNEDRRQAMAGEAEGGPKSAEAVKDDGVILCRAAIERLLAGFTEVESRASTAR